MEVLTKNFFGDRITEIQQTFKTANTAAESNYAALIKGMKELTKTGGKVFERGLSGTKELGTFSDKFKASIMNFFKNINTSQYFDETTKLGKMIDKADQLPFLISVKTFLDDIEKQMGAALTNASKAVGMTDKALQLVLSTTRYLALRTMAQITLKIGEFKPADTNK